MPVYPLNACRDSTKSMCPVKRFCGGCGKTRRQIKRSAVRGGIREHCPLIPALLLPLAARVPRVRVALWTFFQHSPCAVSRPSAHSGDCDVVSGTGPLWDILLGYKFRTGGVDALRVRL
jgi:hypothetical protein